MKRTINLLYIVLISAFFAACHNDEEWTETSGFRIALSDEQVNIPTRTTPAEIGKPVAAKFNLKITSHKNGHTIYNAAYTDAIIPASAGTYSLTASYGDNPALAWDTPYYEGHIDGEVKAEETTSVTIPCSVANSLLTVLFKNPEKFDAYYSSYRVEVKVGNASLNVEKSNAQKSAYFQAGSEVELTFYATLRDNGQEVSMPIKNENLPAAHEAGTHTKLSLTAAIPASGTILTVDKVEVEKITVSETIPLEWLPKPKATGFADGSNRLEYTETDDAPANAVIHYTASSPVQDVEFTLDFKDEQYAKYNKTYTLSAMTEEERTALENEGIILPTIDGVSTAGALDLKALTAKLQTNAGAEVVNTVKLNVKANNRWSNVNESGSKGEGDSYEIKVVKPEFSVNVQPGNVWTKEFTVDEITVSKGNAEKIKSNLVYQYSADDGATWENCSNNQQQIFEKQPDIKDYDYKIKARALFRNTIESDAIEFQLEEPLDLPNSDMEEWHYSQISSNGNPKVVTYFPWGQGKESFWNTNNEYTTRYRQNTFAKPYNSFPAVSYIPEAHSGNRAAELRNTASGSGNTDTTIFGEGKVQENNKVAGILFTGNFNCKTGATPSNSYNMEKGREFNARPTTLRFWYKYAPYNNDDTWQAHIELWDENKDIIIEQTLESSMAKSDYEEARVNLNYETGKKYAKCKYIYIIFSSTINTGADMPFEKFKPTYTLWQDNQAVTHKEPHVGSILAIDDIELIYDK